MSCKKKFKLKIAGRSLFTMTIIRKKEYYWGKKTLMIRIKKIHSYLFIMNGTHRGKRQNHILSTPKSFCTWQHIYITNTFSLSASSFFVQQVFGLVYLGRYVRRTTFIRMIDQHDSFVCVLQTYIFFNIRFKYYKSKNQKFTSAHATAGV